MAIIDEEVWPEKITWEWSDGYHHPQHPPVLLLVDNKYYSYKNHKNIYPLEKALPVAEEQDPNYKKAFILALFNQTIQHILNGDI